MNPHDDPSFFKDPPPMWKHILFAFLMFAVPLLLIEWLLIGFK